MFQLCGNNNIIIKVKNIEWEKTFAIDFHECILLKTSYVDIEKQWLFVNLKNIMIINYKVMCYKPKYIFEMVSKGISV